MSSDSDNDILHTHKGSKAKSAVMQPRYRSQVQADKTKYNRKKQKKVRY